MRKVIALSIAVLFLAVFTTSLYAAKTDSSSDKKFVQKAAAGGMFEVEAGKLATQKASSEEVKNFGQRMVDDHSKANEELKQIATDKGMQLPTQMDRKHKELLAKLSKMSGAEFDREYMNAMIKDHQKDIKEYSRQANKGKDPELKAFASKTLPVLKEHLKLAQDIAGKGGQSGQKTQTSK